MATLTSDSADRTPLSLGAVMKAALVGAGIAAVGNLILLLLAGLFSIPLTVAAGPPGPNTPIMTIGPAQVIILAWFPRSSVGCSISC